MNPNVNPSLPNSATGPPPQAAIPRGLPQNSFQNQPQYQSQNQFQNQLRSPSPAAMPPGYGYQYPADNPAAGQYAMPGIYSQQFQPGSYPAMPAPAQVAPPGYYNNPLNSLPSGYAAVGPSPLSGGLPAIQDYDPYGSPQQANTGSGKRLLLAGAVVLAVIFMVGIAITLTTPSNAPSRNQNSSSNEIALPELVKRPDGTLDLTNRVDVAKVIRAQVINGNINQQLNLSSGLSMMVKAIGDYDSSNAKPASADKKFVVILLAIGNHSTSKNISLSSTDFKLLDGNSQLSNPHATTQQIANNPMAAPFELSPGEDIEGRLVYEVSTSDQSWSFIHKETYRKKSDDSTFTVEGRVALNIDNITTSGSNNGTGSPSVTPSEDSEGIQISGDE